MYEILVLCIISFQALMFSEFLSTYKSYDNAVTNGAAM